MRRRSLIRRGMGRYIPTLIAILCVGIYLFPLYWMLISGFKTQAEIFADPPTFWPRYPTLDSFRVVIEEQNIVRYLRNSLMIATPVALVTVVLSAMGAYAMSRVRSRLVSIVLVIVLLLQVFPEALLATPVFVIFKAIGLVNSLVAVVLATSARSVAFAVVILRPMFRQVPIELEEASRVDGCSQFGTFWRIVVPLMRVPLLVLGAISFAQAYGQFVYPLTLLSSQDLQPGTVGIFSFIGAEVADWHHVMAFSSLFVLPLLVMFLLLQRRIVSGLTAGALK